MSKSPRKKTWISMLVNGTLGGLMIGGMALALLAGQRGEAEAVTFWTRLALVSFGVFLLYALPKLAQSLFQAGTAGLPFHIPWLGAIFGALVVVVAGAAFMTGNNLFYLLLSVLSATLIVSLLANRLNLNRLTVDLRVPPHVFANTPAALDITLTNRQRFLPVFSLSLTLAAPPRAPHDGEDAPQLLACYAIVPPRGRARQQLTHTFTRRGVYALSALALHTRFPFGLVECRLRLRHTGELVVYPPLQPLSAFATAPFWQTGLQASQQRGEGGELYLIRPYQPADRRRAIDWKATAKTAQLMTRELTREEDWQVTLAFDATTPAVNAEQFERAVNFTASLIDWLIARGAALRLLVSAPRLAQNVPEASPVLSGYGAGRAHGLSLLAALARVEMPPPASEQNELINAPDWMARLGHALQRVSLAEQHTPLTTADGLAELADLRDGRSTLMVVTPVSRDALPTWLTTTQVFCFAEL